MRARGKRAPRPIGRRRRGSWAARGRTPRPRPGRAGSGLRVSVWASGARGWAGHCSRPATGPRGPLTTLGVALGERSEVPPFAARGRHERARLGIRGGGCGSTARRRAPPCEIPCPAGDPTVPITRKALLERVRATDRRRWGRRSKGRLLATRRAARPGARSPVPRSSEPHAHGAAGLPGPPGGDQPLRLRSTGALLSASERLRSL